VTRRQALARARELLTRHKIEDAALEAELLLRYTLKINRAQLYTEPDSELKQRHTDTYKTFIKRRIKGEPSAYITGHREFFGLDFYVDKRVLIPRPETELLVEQAITRAKNYQKPVIVDVGTGSGAIAVSVAKNIPNAEIYATDISKAALKAASRNCRKHEVEDRVKPVQGDLLEPAPVLVDIIIANLPYVVTEEVVKMNTTGFEPRLALDGGTDGMDTITRLCQQARERLCPGGCMMLEIGMGQSKRVSDILREIYPAAKIEILVDLSGIDRVVCLTLARE
jgi:release factor glutamine methyltransferase